MSAVEQFLIMEALARGWPITRIMRKFGRGQRTIEAIRDAQPVHS